MTSPKDTSIDALIEHGDLVAAAQRCEQIGQLERAATLFEQVWEFDAAARCALAMGQPLRALDNAARAGNSDRICEIATFIASDAPEQVDRAIDVLRRRSQVLEAARLAERADRPEVAAQYYHEVQRYADAARAHSLAGNDDAAAHHFQQALALEVTASERGPLFLDLADALARAGNVAEAISVLQRPDAPATTAKDQRLVRWLARAGLPQAARSALQEARIRDPSLPAALETFLDATDGDLGRSVEPDTATADATIGNRYEIGSQLGRGATGIVYRCRDRNTGEEVAVKVLDPGLARDHNRYLRFVREARAARAIDSPFLVHVLDFAPDQGYLVMEYIGGGSLDQRPLPLGEALVRSVGIDLCCALDAAHQQGIVHRDIKPANLFLDARGRARVADFGAAHLLDMGATQTGGLIGSLPYLAPEQITGQPLTAAADLYALGITLFELLSGRRPFLGPDYIAQHLATPAPPIRSVAPAVAAGWQAILSRLLRKNPEDRYPSAQSLLPALKGLAITPLHPHEDTRAAATIAAAEDAGALVAAPRPQEASATDNPASDSSTTPPIDEHSTPAEQPRYLHETAISSTSVSRLSRAMDRVLDRSVIIERFEDTVDETYTRRLQAMARCATPYLQRVLDRPDDRSWVFEAPSGAMLQELIRTRAPLSPEQLRRIAIGLTRALQALHQFSTIHGAVDAAHITVDGQSYPTLILAGLPAPETGATALRDIDGIRAALAAWCPALPAATSSDDLLLALASADRSTFADADKG